jgi:hypothetical protein
MLGLIVRCLRALIRHLEKQQVRQLLDVIAVSHPIVPKDIAVTPEFLNDLV